MSLYHKFNRLICQGLASQNNSVNKFLRKHSQYDPRILLHIEKYFYNDSDKTDYIFRSIKDHFLINKYMDRGYPLELRGHTAQNFAVDFSPDMKFLASGGHDETMRLWRLNFPDIHLSTLFRTFRFNSGVSAVTWSPNGRYLAIGVCREVTILERVERVNASPFFPTIFVIRDYKHVIFDLKWTDDSKRLLIIGIDGMSVWEMRSSEMRSSKSLESSESSKMRSLESQELKSIEFKEDNTGEGEAGEDVMKRLRFDPALVGILSERTITLLPENKFVYSEWGRHVIIRNIPDLQEEKKVRIADNRPLNIFTFYFNGEIYVLINQDSGLVFIYNFNQEKIARLQYQDIKYLYNHVRCICIYNNLLVCAGSSMADKICIFDLNCLLDKDCYILKPIHRLNINHDVLHIAMTGWNNELYIACACLQKFDQMDDSSDSIHIYRVDPAKFGQGKSKISRAVAEKEEKKIDADWEIRIREEEVREEQQNEEEGQQEGSFQVELGG